MAVAQLMLVKIWGDTGIWMEGKACGEKGGKKGGSALAPGGSRSHVLPHGRSPPCTDQHGAPPKWEHWGWEGNPWCKPSFGSC